MARQYYTDETSLSDELGCMHAFLSLLGRNEARQLVSSAYDAHFTKDIVR